jgi:hypothetical protein
LFSEKLFISPKTISNISGHHSHDLAVTTGLATTLKTITANHAKYTKIICVHPRESAVKNAYQQNHTHSHAERSAQAQPPEAGVACNDDVRVFINGSAARRGGCCLHLLLGVVNEKWNGVSATENVSRKPCGFDSRDANTPNPNSLYENYHQAQPHQS